jgi:hypothetical protein
LIKLADYTARIDRLKNTGYEDEAEYEVDQLCERLFEATLEDLTQADYDRITDISGELRHLRTIEYCRSCGYDLIINARVRVSYWEDFATMIVAKTHGLLPKTPEERARRRAQIEAEELELEAREAEERAQHRLEAEAREFMANKGSRR